ncbi:hypothetical protein P4B35_11060 [Pontiellaceae bacterium B12227]|nr:hypothetical protein [Pontiellaceae bacterium B12227]
MKKDSTNTMGVVESDTNCIGFHELLDWQIVQYRQCIGYHRLDMSIAEGRCVSFKEAERAVSKDEIIALGEQSQVEYCGAVCPSRENCLLALNFLHQKNTEPLHRVG